MNRSRRTLDRIGGPYAITWTAFWVTYALNLVTHFAGNPGLDAPVLTRLVLVTLSQVAIWLVLLAGRALFLRGVAERPRPFMTLLLFALAGIVRGFVIGVGLVYVGADSSPQFAYRGLAGLFTISTVLTVTAIAVNATREHESRLSTLLASNAALREARSHMTAVIDERNEAAVERIRAELLKEFEALDPEHPAESVSILQRAASDTVRPLSHDLASTVPSWSPTGTVPVSPAINWPLVFDLASRGRPLRPLATGIAMALISFVFVTVFFGPAAGLLLTADALFGCWILLAAGNALLARVLPGRPIQARIIAVTVVGLGAGAIVGFGAFALAQGSVTGQWTWFGSTVITGAMAWLLTIGRAVDEQQGFDEASLAAAVGSLRWEVARVGQVQWHQQQALSRALHGPIQGAVTAAAIRLDGAARSGADTTSLMEQTRDQLREALSLLGDEQASLTTMTDTLTSLREAWRGVCRVDDTASPAVIDALDADELCRSCVGEVLTEAVSNAVRHGGATVIDLTIELGDNVVHIEVRDDGTGGDANASPGLGTRILTECSTQWHRGAPGGGHVLTASLPIAR